MLNIATIDDCGIVALIKTFGSLLRGNKVSFVYSKSSFSIKLLTLLSNYLNDQLHIKKLDIYDLRVDASSFGIDQCEYLSMKCGMHYFDRMFAVSNLSDFNRIQILTYACESLDRLFYLMHLNENGLGEFKKDSRWVVYCKIENLVRFNNKLIGNYYTPDLYDVRQNSEPVLFRMKQVIGGMLIIIGSLLRQMFRQFSSGFKSQGFAVHMSSMINDLSPAYDMYLIAQSLECSPVVITKNSSVDSRTDRLNLSGRVKLVCLGLNSYTQQRFTLNELVDFLRVLLVRENPNELKDCSTLLHVMQLSKFMPILFYRKFYRQHNLRICYTHHISSIDVMTEAIEGLGIKVSVQKSFSYIPKWVDVALCHVRFSWSRFCALQEMRVHSGARYHVVVGNVRSQDFINESVEREFNTMIFRAKRLGIKKTIVVYDTNLKMDRFYRFILQWCADDPALMLIIKSKNNNISRYRDQAEVKRLQAAYKLHIVPGNIISVECLASYADICVGVGTHSAILSAASLGNRSVFLEYNDNFNKRCFIKKLSHILKEDQYIFYSESRLKNAINEFFNAPDVSMVGDLSDTIHYIDAFCDRGANKRIANFLQSYLYQIKVGLSANKALDCAAKMYGELYGSDCVIPSESSITAKREFIQ